MQMRLTRLADAMPHRMGPRTGIQGFSLVEVLVSIVVLCIGLLGMVGLQANSLQANREARLQSAGVALARDLAEMVRGNRAAGIKTGAANPYIVDTASTSMAAATPSYCLSAGSNCVGTGTTPEDIARTLAAAIGNAEMTEWLARVDKELPGARVVVCFDDTPYLAGVPEWPCSSSTYSPLVVKIGWTRASFKRADSTTGAPDRAGTPAIILPLTAGTDL